MRDGYEVARSDDTVYVRVHGLANMKNTPLLDAFLRVELASAVRTACIDLGTCRGMDSTFMGTLYGYHLQLREHDGHLVIVNPSEGNQRLLDMLGISTVVPVLKAPALPEVRFVVLEHRNEISVEERAAMMRRAHRNLMTLNEANRVKFQPFLEALEADLARRRQGDDGI